MLSGLMAAFVTCAAWATRPPAPPSPQEDQPENLPPACISLQRSAGRE